MGKYLSKKVGITHLFKYKTIFIMSNPIIKLYSITNEIVVGDGLNWTLANIPAPGTEALYGHGVRLLPGDDYTISGTSVTTTVAHPWLLADYQL